MLDYLSWRVPLVEQELFNLLAYQFLVGFVLLDLKYYVYVL